MNEENSFLWKKSHLRTSQKIGGGVESPIENATITKCITHTRFECLITTPRREAESTRGCVTCWQLQQQWHVIPNSCLNLYENFHFLLCDSFVAIHNLHTYNVGEFRTANGTIFSWLQTRSTKETFHRKNRRCWKVFLILFILVARVGPRAWVSHMCRTENRFGAP